MTALRKIVDLVEYWNAAKRDADEVTPLGGAATQTAANFDEALAHNRVGAAARIEVRGIRHRTRVKLESKVIFHRTRVPQRR